MHFKRYYMFMGNNSLLIACFSCFTGFSLIANDDDFSCDNFRPVRIVVSGPKIWEIEAKFLRYVLDECLKKKSWRESADLSEIDSIAVLHANHNNRSELDEFINFLEEQKIDRNELVLTGGHEIDCDFFERINRTSFDEVVFTGAHSIGDDCYPSLLRFISRNRLATITGTKLCAHLDDLKRRGFNIKFNSCAD